MRGPFCVIPSFKNNYIYNKLLSKRSTFGKAIKRVGVGESPARTAEWNGLTRDFLNVSREIRLPPLIGPEHRFFRYSIEMRIYSSIEVAPRLFALCPMYDFCWGRGLFILLRKLCQPASGAIGVACTVQDGLVQTKR